MTDNRRGIITGWHALSLRRAWRDVDARPSQSVRACHPSANRRGISLIELTVTMSILSVVMTLVGKTMVLLMRSERTGGQAIVASQGLTRLGNRFRRDVHAAEKAELVAVPKNGVKSLRLTHRNGTIAEYRPEPNGMVVTTRRGKTPLSRESYRLQGTTRFEIADGPSAIVTLIHIPDHGRIADSKSGAQNNKQFRVEAVRGFDQRFHKTP